MRTGWALGLALLLGVLPSQAGRADDKPVPRSAAANAALAAKLDAVLNAPEYRAALWGVLVVDAQTGEEIYAHNADKLFRPASTTKLYSCAAALVALGADYKFETPVYRRGEINDGRLQGDLIVVGQGDLTLGGRTDADGRLAFKDHDHTYANGNNRAELTDTDPLAGLKELARQVAAAGIRRVEGDVLVDDRLFTAARGSGSGPDLLTPILVNDNVVDVLIRPGEKPGTPATVTVRPETNYIHYKAEVETAAAGTLAEVSVQPNGPESFAVRGRVAVGARPLVRVFAVGDPAGFARRLFLDALRHAGVEFAGDPRKGRWAELPPRDAYGKLPCVARFTSPPLSEALKVTLKVSHNLYASTLPLLLAARKGQRTLSDGMRIERNVLAGLGVDVGTVSFGGGAGGAPADHVTPRATVQLLRALAKRPDYPVFHAALPVLGVDGTLADAVPKDSPARGKAHAKTGTLFYRDLFNGRDLLTSKALAGTLTTAGKRELVFAAFVNNVPLPPGVGPTREGRTLGRLCEVLYEFAPPPRE
jgi:D-alanyl-D-alanine carboxypeptidase/D-alanyl-D-alanine-endopeptidase (penicillin-binding protein 4)